MEYIASENTSGGGLIKSGIYERNMLFTMKKQWPGKNNMWLSEKKRAGF